MRLEFRLLGDVAVLADGHPLDLGGTRQRSVLAILVLQRNHPIATEQLADRLWPDEQPLAAVKTIQVYVSRLRHLLGSDADRLTSSSIGYQLAVGDDELDAARFERGLRLAREALAAGFPETSLAMLEEAIALWAGAALADLAAEQFARREAERLEELRIQAFEELFELRIDAGKARETIGELRRLLGDEPGRERLWRLLMLALYADSRQGEALQAYQDARRYLADELGLDPSQELQDIERAILTQTAPRLQQVRVSVASAGDDRSEFTSPPQTRTPVAESTNTRTRRIVTVLRAEIVRPTGSHAVDPEVLELADRPIVGRLYRAVERHGGTIDTDPRGVTAIFGLTLAREDDALRAVRAAAEMRDGGDTGRVGGPEILAIGIATGEVIVGSDESGRLSVTGAAPQSAWRLAAAAHAQDVLLTSETRRLIGDGATTDPIPEMAGGDVSDLAPLRLVELQDGEAIARRSDTPLIGRIEELDRLLDAFDRVKTGDAPGLVTVMGAPGIGKSRLVAEFLSRIGGGAQVLRARCLPYGEGITYWPVRELVLAAVGIDPAQPTDVLLTGVRSVTDRLEQGDAVRRGIAAIVGVADGSTPAEEIPWAIRRFFEALSAEHPLVLVVDDLQWAEPALLDLVDHVLDLGRGRMLIVAIARSELLEGRPDWLSRPSLALIRLEPLADTDAAVLLDHLAPSAIPVLQWARILEAAEGNPLFVEQLAAYLSEQTVAARVSEGRVDVALPIPPTIASLLAARIDRLPPEERLLLRRASVFGRRFTASEIRELLPDEARAAMAGSLARLARRELIRPVRADVSDDEAFIFRHLLIRDAAYATVPRSELADLHLQVATLLERSVGSQPDQFDLIVGHHLEQAYRNRVALGDNGPDVRAVADRALSLIGAAGQRAEARGDSHAAVSLLSRAADLAAPGPNRTELLLELRSALRTIGALDRAELVDAELVAALAAHPDDALERRRALVDARFSFNTTLEQATEAYAFFERTSDALGMIRALDVAYAYHVMRGEFAAATAMIDRAIALAEASGRSDLVAWFVSESAMTLIDSPVPVPEALERCRGYLDRLADNRARQAGVLLTIGQLEARSGAHPEWRQHFEAARAIIDDLGLVMPLGAGIYPIWFGDTALAVGEPALAVDMLRHACAELERLGDAQGSAPSFAPLTAQSARHGRVEKVGRVAFWGLLATVAPLTAQMLLALGELDEVERYAFWGRDVAEADDLDAQARWRIAIAGLRSQQGRHDEAIALARDSVALLAESQSAMSLGTAYLRLAMALRAAGDLTAAMGAAQDAHRIAAARKDQAALSTIEAFVTGR